MQYGISEYGVSNYGDKNVAFVYSETGIQIAIAGIDYTNNVELTSVKITSNIAVNQDTFALDVIIAGQSLSRPKGGQEIVVTNGSFLVYTTVDKVTTSKKIPFREFAGVILAPQEEMYAPDVFVYHITCKDYTYYLDKRLVVNTYVQLPVGSQVGSTMGPTTPNTIGNIAIDIVNNFTSGFTCKSIVATDKSFSLTSKKFDHIYPSVALQWLADSIGVQWWVDYYKDVHLGQGIGQDITPLPNNTLLPDTDIENYDSLIFSEDVSQLRNQIYLTGYKIPALYTVTQSFVADGQNTTFTTNYEPKHDLASITVKVGSVTKISALDLVSGAPSSTVEDGTCYIYYTNNTFRFNVAPVLNAVVKITYNPMFPMVNAYNDPDSFIEMGKRDNQGGVYEYAVSDSNLSSLSKVLADTSGQLQLLKYAYPHITGTFNSYLQGWMASQYFYLTSAARMDGQFNNQMFYVLKVDKTIVSHPINGIPIIYYTISFSDTPYSY